MKNWKTTLFGTLTTICVGLSQIETQYKNYFIAGSVIFGTLFALFSKDNNVTGGDINSIAGGGIKNPPKK